MIEEALSIKLNEAEQDVVQSAMNGTVACFGEWACGKKDEPVTATKKSSIRISKELIYWLCTEEKAQRYIHCRGIQLIGAKFQDDLDFDYAELLCPLALFDCELRNVILVGAETKSLYFNGSFIDSFFADGLIANGDIILNDSTVRNGIRLLGAQVAGNLECMGATLHGESDINTADGSISKLDKNHLVNNKSLLSLKKRKEKRLLSTTQNFDKTLKRVTDSSGYALNAGGSQVGADVRLDFAHADTEICFVGGEIGGDLICSGALFQNPNSKSGRALSLDGHSIGGDVFLDNVSACGEVRLLGVRMHGDLVCTGSTFNKSSDFDTKAFYADELLIEGNVFFNRVTSCGEVSFHGAQVGNRMICSGSSMENKGDRDKVAFSIENAEIKGTLALKQVIKVEDNLIMAFATAKHLDDDDTSWPKQGKGSIDLNGFKYSIAQQGRNKKSGVQS